MLGTKVLIKSLYSPFSLFTRLPLGAQTKAPAVQLGP